MSREVDRRSFLKLAGTTAGAAAVAGCTGGDSTPTAEPGGDGGDGGSQATATPTEEATGTGTGTETPAEPETREGYLQRANRVLHDEAPWIYLNRQYSVYGKSNRVAWQARRDERIEAYAVEPTEGSSVTIT